MIRRYLYDLPLIVTLMGVAALSMLLPAVFAGVSGDPFTGRVFLYGGVVLSFLVVLLAIATHRPSRNETRALRSETSLLPLAFAYFLLPVIFAIPFFEAVRNTTFLNAYVEMVSSFTTTGMTLYPDPDRLSPSLHLWRAQVGWMGGFFIWTSALAVFAPLNLGGFEVSSRSTAGQIDTHFTQIERQFNLVERFSRYGGMLFPIYVTITAILWLSLLFLGDTPFVALCHAMSTIATSGISPIGGLENANSGLLGEGAVFLFFIFALTRVLYMKSQSEDLFIRLKEDPELRLSLLIIVLTSLFLFLRHWFASLEFESKASLMDTFHAIWGSVFTVASFLTTTGFESADWSLARAWSGLPTPGLILVGLSMIGGGIATTAGGVKLLRVYALYQHSRREMDRLSHPHAIGGVGQTKRHFRRQGAVIAWIFFMLFAMTLALFVVLFSATGMPFEAAIITSSAMLTNAGPLVEVALAEPLNLEAFGAGNKWALILAMIIGRIETLALVALLNPIYWRKA
ncbi:MAG: TrkH family potassium uptake protein [Halocynthiibacter sp.]